MAGEWSNSTLGKICSFAAGSAFPKNAQGDGVGKYPFIKVSDMNLAGNERSINTANNWIGQDTQVRLRAKVHPPGATVFAKIGVALTYNRRRLLKQPTIIDNNMMAGVPRNEIVDSLFFYYLLCTIDFNEVVVGTALPYLNISDLSRMSVSLPSPREQQAIACILGALDDKIELNRRMNRTLEATAQAIFKSWFVDFDPVRAKATGQQPSGLKAGVSAMFPDAFEDSELGKIPSGWRVRPLYETAQWVNGDAFKSEDFCAAREGLPVIKIAELKDGVSTQTKWCQRCATPNQTIDTGDLLYSWSGSPDTSLEAFLWSGGRGLLNQHIFKVITQTAAEKHFVYYLLQHLRPLLVETARNKQTTGLGHVTIADMKRLLVCWPSKPVLALFDQNIAPIFEKAFSTTIECRSLAALRDALLPKLISGELRVSDAERIVGRCA